MKSLFFILLIFMAGMIPFAVNAVPQKAVPENNVVPISGWTKDFRMARKNALATKRLVLILFTLSGEGGVQTRQMQGLMLYSRKFIENANKDFVLVHAEMPRKNFSGGVSGERARRLAGRFGVSVYPAVVIASPDSPWGNLLYRHFGVISGQTFLEEAEKRLPQLKTLRSQREKSGK